MQNSKLLTILRSLSRDDFREFGNFVSSDYFNRSKKLSAMYKYFKPLYPEFKAVDKKILFAAMYPDEKFNERKLANQLSRFVGLALDFLAVHEFLTESFNVQAYSLQRMIGMKLDDYVDGELKALDAKIEASPLRDKDYYLKRSVAISLRRRHLENTLSSGKMKPAFECLLEQSRNENVHMAIANLLNHIKLKDAAGLVNVEHANVVGILTDLGQKMHGSFSDVPAFQILYKIFQLDEPKADDKAVSYREIKTLLDNNPHVFTGDDRKFFIRRLAVFDNEKLSRFVIVLGRRTRIVNKRQ